MVLFGNVLYLFLYFPEDKTEYIPAFVTSVIFLGFALIAMRFFINHSKKEQEKAKELEEKLRKENDSIQ